MLLHMRDKSRSSFNSCAALWYSALIRALASVSFLSMASARRGITERFHTSTNSTHVRLGLGVCVDVGLEARKLGKSFVT